jgi:alkylated DNA nucleotide flippase Atl1
VSFLDLVQGEKQFQVPLYQRPYSWLEPQLSRLWRDILEQSAAMADSASQPRHFIGSVVIAPSPALHAAGVQRWLVVDGQQRLTTLMLALAALRDHIEISDSRDADRIHRQYLVNEFRQGDEHLRLLPTQADRDVYRALLLRHPAPEHGNISEAYRHFRTALVAADDPNDDEDLTRIESTIRAGLSIVEITAEAGDNVYRIFESLNNTGMKLSQADLLRNYLFMRLPRRGEDVYRDVWLPMQDSLTGPQLELLVWLDLVIRGDERVKQSEIYRAQQERLEKIAEGDEAAIEAEIVELARRSRHLERILDPSKEPDEQLRRALRRLRAWGAQTAYPLVMHLLDLRDRGVTDAADVADALTFIESFLVRRMICQVPTNNLNRVFNASPTAVGDAAPLAPAVRRYLSGRRRYWPSDGELRNSVRSRPFYWTGRGPQRVFVLRSLEESYQAAEPVDYDRAKLTIEHVLPQTLTQEWIELLAAEVTDEGGPKQLHELIVHTLGNLTLTAENAKLSNSPFQRKQDIYQSSALRMNREIADSPAWGKAQILTRADALAERAIRLWPGPVNGVADDAEGRDWSLLRKACAAIPPGAWTTYGDLAELIGSHPVPVGVHLATHPVPNAWRVLTSDGKISPGFRWEVEGRTDDPQQLLESEGVTFTGGRAAATQRLTGLDLAALVGMEASEPVPATEAKLDLNSPAGQRFLSQLTEAHPEAVEGVQDLLSSWETLGGELSYGSSAETSCFLTLEPNQYELAATWPLVIYPQAGVVEVVFQHMRRRPVFDDAALREEFRERLEQAGVDIPRSKLSLRPSFALDAVSDPARRSALKAALEWFAMVFYARLAQADHERAPSLFDVGEEGTSV